METVRPLVSRAGFQAFFEPITDARLGDEQAWLIWVRLDLLADLTHQYTKVLDVIPLATNPNFLEQLIVGDYEPDMRCQRSGSLNAAIFRSSAAFSASTTEKPWISKPERRKLCIFGSPSIKGRRYPPYRSWQALIRLGKAVADGEEPD